MHPRLTLLLVSAQQLGVREQLVERGIVFESEVTSFEDVTENTVVVGAKEGADKVLDWCSLNHQSCFGVAVIDPSAPAAPEAQAKGLHFFVQFLQDASASGEVYYDSNVLIDVLARRCAAPSAKPKTPVTILGFGSLLSETSARTTFPDLENFRLVRVRGWRRVFAHAAAIFFERGIANKDTLEFASLSAEFVNDDYKGFMASAFEVRALADDWGAFLEREEEFDLVDVPYDKNKSGVMCSRSSDAAYIARWGRTRYENNYLPVVRSIWDWPKDSGLRPCAVYLRHCVLAVTKAGPEALDSFLDDTYLVDRTTSLRDYLRDNPQVMHSTLPPSLIGRYSG